MRAFLAVELSEELRQQISRVQQQMRNELDSDRDVRVTWVRPATIHMTVKFLGDIDEQHAQPLREAIREVIGASLDFSIPMDRAGVFPRPVEPRVIWIGPSRDWDAGETGKRLTAIVRSIDAACARFGAAREDKPWRPHLTIGRVRSGEREVGRVLAKSGLLAQPLSIDPLPVTSVALMKSDLRPDGPLHTELWRLPE